MQRFHILLLYYQRIEQTEQNIFLDYRERYLGHDCGAHVS